MTLVLALSYAAVAALLLNLGVRSRWPTGVKLTAIVLVSLLYAGTFLGLRSLEGWPTKESPASGFRLLSVLIVEPDSTLDVEGAIYYWARTLDEAGEPTGPPRSYQRPYQPLELKAARKAQDLLDDGRPIDGRLLELSDDLSGSENSESLRERDEPEFEFQEAAPPALPPKIDP